VVDLDVRTCTNRTVKLEGAISPLSMVTDGTRFITTEVVNSTSKIRAFDKTGHMVREQSVSRHGGDQSRAGARRCRRTDRTVWLCN
jgi:hypothetical protein